jgi:hypothetical protein
MELAVILVMWFGTTHGGPTMLHFDDMASCERALEAIGEEYLPKRHDNPEDWTANTSQIRAFKRSKCVEY